MKGISNIGLYVTLILLSMQVAVLNGQVDTLCFNDTILYSLPNTGNSVYNWNVQGGLILESSRNMDSVTVVWNVEKGLHKIEVTKLSETYCNSEPKVLEVYIHSASIDLGEDIAICEGNTEMIVATSGYVEYLWNNQSGTNEFKVSSEGIVKLEVKDKYGCWSKDNLTIIENKNPNPDFTIQLDTLNQLVYLINLSDSLSEYHWDFGDAEYSDEYNPDYHTYSHSGTYDISLTEYVNSCSAVIVKEVSFSDKLVSDFEYSYEGCAPTSVTFNNHSTNAEAYAWDFGNGATSVDENPVTNYKNSGTYEVILSARKGKVEKISKKIIVISQAPEAIFNISHTEAKISEDIKFFNESTNAVKYLWHFGEGEFSESFEPTHTYSLAGRYDISLSVWSENGCFDSLFVPNAIIIANDCQLIFPSGFIANKNGSCGGFYNPSQQEDNNEIFHPIYKNIDEYELKIYNRWGVLVFVSKNIDVGWDGYYNGKLAPQDTYLYTVKSRCITGKEIKTTGGITLIY